MSTTTNASPTTFSFVRECPAPSSAHPQFTANRSNSAADRSPDINFRSTSQAGVP